MPIRLEFSREEKLRELILYLCRRSVSDEAFGATKLNKLLFYSDFGAYIELGQPLTGVEYQKLPNGPAPRPMKPIMEEMVERGELAIADLTYHGRKQKVPFAMRDPDLSRFSGEEIALVGLALERFRNMNASEISQHSHGFIGWRVAQEGETIPYEAALLGDPKRELTEAEIEFAHSLDMTEAVEIMKEYASAQAA